MDKKGNKIVRLFYLVGVMLLYVSCYSQEVIKGKRISRSNDYAITLPNKNNANHVRLEVKAGDIASNGGRAEIMAEHSGFEQEYSFSFKIHKYKYELDKHFILADWHHSTELHRIASRKGENLYSPLVVHLIGDRIVLANRAGRYTGTVGNLKLDPNFTMNMLRVPINYKGWNTVYVKIKWSDKANGAIYAKINGKELNAEGVRTTYDMEYPNFFKVGIYRNLTYQTDAIFEFKDMKVGNKRLIPDFNRKLTGEKNNDPKVIEAVRKKFNQK